MEWNRTLLDLKDWANEEVKRQRLSVGMDRRTIINH